MLAVNFVWIAHDPVCRPCATSTSLGANAYCNRLTVSRRFPTPLRRERSPMASRSLAMRVLCGLQLLESQAASWRFQEEAGDAVTFRRFGDDAIVFNMSTWESLDAQTSYFADPDRHPWEVAYNPAKAGGADAARRRHRRVPRRRKPEQPRPTSETSRDHLRPRSRGRGVHQLRHAGVPLPGTDHRRLPGDIEGLLVLPVQRNNAEDARGRHRALQQDQERSSLRSRQAAARLPGSEAPQGAHGRAQRHYLLDGSGMESHRAADGAPPIQRADDLEGKGSAGAKAFPQRSEEGNAGETKGSDSRFPSADRLSCPMGSACACRTPKAASASS